MEKGNKIILGIDPGTNIMGYGIIEAVGKALSLLKMDVLKFDPKTDAILRLRDIFIGTTQIIEEYNPDVVAIESQFYGKNVQSMLKLGRAQGVAIAAAAQRGIPVFEYSPRKVKQAITGKGGASKEQVAGMLKHLIQINETIAYLDASDAVAIALCHHIQSTRMVTSTTYSGWSAFIAKQPDRVVK
ncbi:MAG: crossover junction endodeoxyribonuclease RuvC [Bacteroidales bacterium]|jgi:crossover junction endodeoxyribonuclease RuvC|nr:crossover junction endodeoxyribonuclease RuvC [Bacteroidales bacterium]